MKQRNESELLHMAAAYCSTGEHCIQDVRKKLNAAEASPEAEKRIIDRLLAEKFIDESRFCRSFVKDKFRFNHWGRIRIRYELQKKGLAPEVISEAMDDMDEEAYLSALSAMLKEKKRTTRGRSEQELFLKLCRFAGSRGFEGALITQCLKPLFKEDCDVNMDDGE
ncbi:MAG: RecX family transcriptional regulator [Tannerella sp.]|nr:RecX family transcriptional regulator [Tannerella sp.]